MPTLSDRGRLAPASPIRKLVPLADAARRRGLHVYQLNIGQPDIETPQVLREGLQRFDEPVIAYSPSAGTEAFRAFLMEYYRRIGAPLAQGDLLVTTGGSEAILFAMAATMDLGDRVLIPDPMYANYIGFATLLGLEVVPVPTRVEDGYHLPLELDRYWQPGVKAVLLCNPSNPTGAVYTPEELRRVVDFCVQRDLFLIGDEVYREFTYETEPPRSLLTWPEVEDRVIVVDSLSKRYSLCGARIGCMVTRNREVAAAALRFAQARLSPPGLAQAVGARAALLDPDYFTGVRESYRARRDLVYEALRAIPGTVVHRPEGAFYLMARLPVADAEDFVRFLLEDFEHEGQTVMVAPAAGFYATPGAGRDEVRIAYVLNEVDLSRAMECLRVGLLAYQARGR